MPALIFIILCIVSTGLYRAGGSSLKIKLKTKFRDWGCPACGISAMLILHVDAPIWAHVAYFGLAWAALSTYWDRWGTDDVEWYEWLITGIGYALAVLPYAIATGQWEAFWAHAAAQIGLFMAVRLGSKNVWVEECGSGASIIISKLAFLIP